MKTQTHDEPAVTGTGVDVEGTPFYVVPSSTEPGRVHLVRQLPRRLVCDCKAAHYGKRCVHVAAVVAHKQRQQLAIARAESVAEVTAGLQATLGAGLDDIAATLREMTGTATSPTGYGVKSAPRQSLLNRTRAFSLLA